MKAIGLFVLVLLLVPFSPAQTQPAGAWSSAGSLNAWRTNAAAANLQDGRILITGGVSNGTALASAEIYDGKTFTPVASMSVARSQHAIATLKNGHVVVAGGLNSAGLPLSSIEVYDPDSNTWTPSATGMVQARAGATLTVLDDGRLLLAGGTGASGPLASLEIYDPAADSSTLLAATMPSPRAGHAAALLPNGAVVLAGGTDGSKVLASVDAYDPKTNAIAAPLNMSVARMNLTATALLDGRVLLAGGNNGTSDLATLEVADLATGTISVVGSLATARSSHLAFSLPNNANILIVGGMSGGSALASAELFSPATSTVRPAGNMSVARSGAVAGAAGNSGFALVAGGEAAGPNSAGDLFAFATLSTDKPDYAPNTPVVVSGAGWAPGESVTLVFHENPAGDPDATLTATADATGAFQNNAFKPDVHDQSINFVLTATGATSGLSAQTVFTDYSYGTTLSSPTPTSGAAYNTVSVSATLQYGVPQYQTVYYSYVCGSYSCNCGWFSCDTCYYYCTGSYLQYVGTNYYPLANQPVQFYFDVGTLVTATTNSNGVATALITVPVGATSLTANFAGSTDGTYGPSTASSPFTVLVSATSVSMNPASATYGDSQSTLSARLTAGGNPVQGESLSMQIDGNNAGSASTDATGLAVVNASLAGLNAGPHSISAQFAGDTILGSSSGSNTLSIAKGTQASVAVTGPASVTYGTTGVATAGGGSGTGAYVFSSGASTGCSVTGTVVSVSNASGTCVLTAYRAGDINYNDSAPSAPFTVTLQKANQAAVSVSAPTDATYGQPGGTAVASGGSGTGAYSFSAGTSTACSIDSASGVITVTSGTGTCAITATRAGDNNYSDSAPSAPATVTIHKANQAAVSVTAPTDATYGQPGGTAVASGGSGTGAYSYSAGASTACSVNATTGAISVTSGTGTCAITAMRAGDSNYNDSTPSAAATVNIHKATPTVTATGGTFTFDGTSHAGSGSATGIPADGTLSPAVTLTYSGTGSTLYGPNSNAAPSNAGTYTVAAHFAGNSNYLSGDSAAAALTISKAPTSATVVSSANPAKFGQSVTFTATITNTANGAQPTGTVTLSIDGSPVAATVSGSGNSLSATYSSTTLAAGSHTVSVSYTNSDGNFAGSSGNLAGNQAVQYGFVGLLSPYAAPPTAYKIKSAIPLKWQYTDVNGTVVASPNASPVIQIFAMPGCASTSGTAILVDDAGSSGYQYDSTTNTWQFNWKTSPSTVAPGCYGISITSNQSGQTNGAFPIQLSN